MPIHGSMAFVSVAPKKAQKTSFVEPLAKFISREYQQDPADIKEPVKELTELRNACVVAAPEKHESGLKAVMKYYGRLTLLSRRFPFKTSEAWDGVLPSPVVVKFAWEDSRGSTVFGGKKVVTLEDINFELINVLFNIGAVHTQIGAMTNVSSDAGLKNASVNFQSAAVAFNNVAALVHKYYTKPPSADLDAMFLHALSFLMLAQSQEMYWRKCVVERKSNGTIAKLAKQTSSFYADAHRNLTASGVADKAWIAISQAKHAYYEADAQYRTALADKEEEEMGRAIARLRVAETKLAEAAHQATGTDFKVSNLQSTIASLITQFEKENSMIYMKVVPPAAGLPPISQHATVSADKPLPDFTDKEYVGEDPFDVIVPVAVRQGAQRYEERRDAFVREQVNAINESTNKCVQGLTEMGLPGSLQAVQNPSEIPQALVAQCEEIRASGGADHLRGMIEALPEKSKMCREMLQETREKLDQEQRDDEELRSQHGARWAREPSAKLTVNMRKEVDKYSGIVENAANSDQTVIQRFHDIEPAISFMAGPIEEVKRMLPTTTSEGGPTNAVDHLMSLLERLDELRARRDAMSDKFDELKKTDDITPLLVEKGTTTDEATLFEEQLKHYAVAVEEAADLVRETDEVMEKTREANGRFQAGKAGAGGAGSEREAMLNDLASKYEAWKTLTRDLTEGSKFYEQLTGLLSKQQAKCTDFCMARDFEKKDLAASINRSIASVPSESYSSSSSSGPADTTGGASSSSPQSYSSYSQPPVSSSGMAPSPYPAVPQAPHQQQPHQQPPPQSYLPQSSYQAPYGQPPYGGQGYTPPYQQPQQPPQQQQAYAPPYAGYSQPYQQPPPPQQHQQQQGPYGYGAYQGGPYRQ